MPLEIEQPGSAGAIGTPFGVTQVTQAASAAIKAASGIANNNGDFWIVAMPAGTKRRKLQGISQWMLPGSGIILELCDGTISVASEDD